MNPTITSLALLKANFEESGKDYFENFVPMAAECLRRSGEDVVSVTELQGQLRDQFGLLLPQSALKTILNRARRQGLVRLESKVYYRNVEVLERLEFGRTRQRVVEIHESLIREFVEFCAHRFDKHLSPEDADAALQSYLEENQLLLVDAVTERNIVPHPAIRVENARFLLASFVRHLQETQAAALDHLETIVKGHMLANAIFLPDPGSVLRKFRGTEVYFDTPFLIDALGYGGESQQAPCLELLDLLYETGAELRCFDHTRDEVLGVLQACVDLMRSGNGRGTSSGPDILRNFHSEGLSSTDVMMKMNSLEKDLRRLHIRVVDKPGYEAQYQIDEEAFGQEIDESLNYRRERQIARDVDSISAIMRLRKGKNCPHVEECRAVFVTTNSGLARIARQHFSDATGTGSVPPCLTDYALTNLLWLKKPTAAPDLPRKRIIADCYAATRPSERLWRNFVEEIERLRQRGEIDAEEYYLLRSSMKAETALMDATMGQEDLLTQGTVPEILGRWRSEAEAEKQVELDAEKASRQITERQLEAERTERREQDDRRRANVQRNARTIARWLVKVLLGALLGLLVLGSAYSFPWDLPKPSFAWMRYLVTAALLLFFVMSAANLVLGTSLLGACRRLEVVLARRIERGFLTLTGEEGPQQREQP